MDNNFLPEGVSEETDTFSEAEDEKLQELAEILAEAIIYQAQLKERVPDDGLGKS